MRPTNTPNRYRIDSKKIQSWLSGLIDNMPGIVVIVDPEWHLEYMNRAAEELFGRDKDILIGQNFDDIYPKHLGVLFKPDWMQDMLSKGELQRDIFSVKLNKWFEARVYSQGGHIYIRLEDITVEIYQKKIMRLMQLSVNNTTDMAFWFKPGGHIIYANRSACESLGYTEKELTSMKLSDLGSNFSVGEWMEHFKKAGREDSSTFESSLFARDGHFIAVEVSINFVNYYNDEYIVAFARDITERKVIETRLQESEEKFRRTFDQSPIGAAIVSLCHRYTRVNAKLCEITGYSETELLTLSFPDITHPDDMPAQKELTEKLLAGEIDQYQMDKRYIRKNGEIVWARLNVRIMKNPSGQPLCLLPLMEDITDRKRIEKELQNAKMKAEMYNDLLGHDTNNMNQVAMGYLEMANDILNQKGKLDLSDRILIAKPYETLQKSSQLIENVRKLQHINDDELKFEDVDVGKVLDDLKELYAGNPGNNVTILYTPTTGCITRANRLLGDVFSNIVGNSIKHTGGPVIINILMTKVWLQHRKYLKVVIDDTGPGIVDDMKIKIFTRFQRGNTHASGKGLGLYLVKTLVENYRGKVWVEDRVPGDHTKGARFVILLPALDY
jgi:PAS domain S-box-containing protein